MMRRVNCAKASMGIGESTFGFNDRLTEGDFERKPSPEPGDELPKKVNY